MSEDGSPAPARSWWPVSGQSSLLAWASLVNSVGHGLSMSIVALYFTAVMGVGDRQVLVAAAIAGGAALLVSRFMGKLADRVGSRPLMVVAALVAGLLGVALLFAKGFPALVAILVGQMVTSVAYSVSRSALIPQVVPQDQRVKTRAFLRTVVNAGMVVGFALAIPATQSDDLRIWRALIAVDAATFFITAVLAWRLQPVIPVKKATAAGHKINALKDRRFVGFAGVNAVFGIQNKLFTLALMLWIAARSDAPGWLIPVVLIVNSAVVIALQVPLSRGSESVAGAVRAQRWSGALLAGACVCYSFSAGATWQVATAVIIAGAVLHSLGEVLQMAGAFGISYELAPEGHHGEYQGTYAMGQQLADLVGPLVLAALVMGNGRWGWLGIAALFLLGAAVVHVMGERLRHPAATSADDAPVPANWQPTAP